MRVPRSEVVSQLLLRRLLLLGQPSIERFFESRDVSVELVWLDERVSDPSATFARFSPCRTSPDGEPESCPLSRCVPSVVVDDSRISWISNEFIEGDRRTAEEDDGPCIVAVRDVHHPACAPGCVTWHVVCGNRHSAKGNRLPLLDGAVDLSRREFQL